MLSILAINWEPELRGIVIVAISVGVLIGGTYLVVGTNLGARLGFGCSSGTIRLDGDDGSDLVDIRNRS